MTSVNVIINFYLPEKKSAEQVTWIVFTLAWQVKVRWSKVKWKLFSHVWLFAASRIYSRWNLLGIFLTQGSNPGLPHHRQILYQLSHQGKWKWNWSHTVLSGSATHECSLPGSSIHGILQARVLEWVAISFSRRIFPTKESNWGLQHCRQILYQLHILYQILNPVR